MWNACHGPWWRRIQCPRQLVLIGADGQMGFFDLSGPEETLDLSLTPEVIDWIGEHFRLEKLQSDYPHWDDADRDPNE